MFKFLNKNEEPKDIKTLLSHFKSLKEKFNRISKKMNALENDNKFSLQGLGVIRFNPFKESGGDQSFSIAFLDGNNDGVVITSLYGREDNRVFAKPIKNCKSDYTLTEEEKKAIEKAKESKLTGLTVKPQKKLKNKNDSEKI